MSGAAPDGREAGPAFVDSWLQLIRRRWRSGALVCATVLAAGAAVLLMSPPIYRSETRLRLGEPPPMSGVSPNGGILNFFRLGGDPFANDLELLDSRSLAEAVVGDAALNVALAAPRGWHRDSLFASLAADTTTAAARFSLEWLADGRVRITQTRPRERQVTEVRAGETVRFGGVVLQPRPWREGMPRRVSLSTVPFAEAVRRARGRIRTERTRRDANVVQIVLQDADPGIATAAVSSAVERFIALRTTIQSRESRQTVDSLRVVAAATRQELAAAEQALERLQRQDRLFAPAAQGEALAGQFAGARAELEKARLDHAAITSTLARAGAHPDPAVGWTALVSHPAFLSNETMGALLTELTRLEQQRRELAARRTPENQEYRLLVERIAYLDGSLRRLATQYEAALRDHIRGLEGLVGMIDRRVESAPAQMLELGRQERAVRLLSEIVLLTEARLRQEELRNALTYANVQVVDPPALLPRPVWPPLGAGLGAVTLVALLSGLLGMVVRDRADTSVRSALQIRGSTAAPILVVATARADGAVFGEHEVHALLRNGAREGAAPRFTLVPVDQTTTAEHVVQALAHAGNGNGALAEPEALVGGNGASPQIRLGPRCDSFAAAAAAVALDAPILLLVRYGVTRRDELLRVTERVREAGGTIAGTIVLCPRPADAVALWQ